MAEMTRLEWQIAEGSRTAHIVDTARPRPRWSGRRALCKRYPQKNREEPWFCLRATEPGVEDAIRRYRCRLCPECLAAPVPHPAATDVGDGGDERG